MRTLTVLLLILWFSRIVALDALPLHNDEGLHLTRGVEVWNLHPFWEITDGKIINHWAIALFYPQNAPVFAGRIATVFISLIGFAAGYALLWRHFGATAALIGGALWIASPYLFFFERLALSDAEAGALVVLTLWASLKLAERGTIRRALLAGLALALAALFKFTAVPFALSVAVIVLLCARYPLRRRILVLVVAALVVAACFVAPVAYLLVRGDSLFAIALGWISGSGGTQSGIGANVAMLASQLTDFGAPLWSLLLMVGLALLLVIRLATASASRLRYVLLLALGLPLASIIILGREVLPRHYVVALPTALILGGAGIGLALDRLLAAPTQQRMGALAVCVLLAIPFVPFALTAYAAPDQLPLPAAVLTQYVTEHSAGYGLREAVLAFPQTITPRDVPIVASMTPDSCRRANFYAVSGLSMICADAPGLTRMATELQAHGQVYVVVEQVTGAHFPQDAASLGAQAQQIAIYPRPGANSQTVTLWRLYFSPQ